MFFTESQKTNDSNGTWEFIVEGKLLNLLRSGDKNILPKGQFSGDLKNCIVLDAHDLMNDELKKGLNKEWPTIKKSVFDWLEKAVKTDTPADAKAVKDEYLEYLDSIVLYPGDEDSMAVAIQANGAKNSSYSHGMNMSNLFVGHMIYTTVILQKNKGYSIDKKFGIKTVYSKR